MQIDWLIGFGFWFTSCSGSRWFAITFFYARFLGVQLPHAFTFTIRRWEIVQTVGIGEWELLLFAIIKKRRKACYAGGSFAIQFQFIFFELYRFIVGVLVSNVLLLLRDFDWGFFYCNCGLAIEEMHFWFDWWTEKEMTEWIEEDEWQIW